MRGRQTREESKYDGLTLASGNGKRESDFEFSISILFESRRTLGLFGSDRMRFRLKPGQQGGTTLIGNPLVLAPSQNNIPSIIRPFATSIT